MFCFYNNESRIVSDNCSHQCAEKNNISNSNNNNNNMDINMEPIGMPLSMSKIAGQEYWANVNTSTIVTTTVTSTNGRSNCGDNSSIETSGSSRHIEIESQISGVQYSNGKVIKNMNDNCNDSCNENENEMMSDNDNDDDDIDINSNESSSSASSSSSESSSNEDESSSESCDSSDSCQEQEGIIQDDCDNDEQIEGATNNNNNNNNNNVSDDNDIKVESSIAIDNSSNKEYSKYDSDCDVNEYLFEILYNSLKMDDNTFKQSSKYRQFDKEKEILTQYRGKCINHIHHWYKKYHLSIDTFALSIEILHRLMGELHLTKTNVFLLAFTILYISAKYHENDNSHSKARLLFRNVIGKDNKFYKEAILKLEMQFLACLNYSLTFPTCVTFSEIYLSLFINDAAMSSNVIKLYNNENEIIERESIKKHIRDQIYAILENGMMRSYSAYYKPSIIAAICVKHVLSVFRSGNIQRQFDFSFENDSLNNILTQKQHLTKDIKQSKTGIQIANLCHYLMYDE